MLGGFDIHLNSEVFYLSGSMYAPDSSMHQIEERISRVLAIPQHTLFDECVSNLSRDASFIMVADMDKVAQNLDKYKGYLPTFIYDHIELFRSFILSVQITRVNGLFSHILVFTYKE